MAWKSVFISKQSRLKLKQSQMLVEQDENSCAVALEEISALVLETHQATVTTALLSALGQRQVAIFTCDDKHLPNAVMLPLSQHSRSLHVLRKQLDLTESMKKRLWQILIKQKIKNQGYVLGDEHRNILKAMADQVGSGDKDNVEARAAQYYWKGLFENFARSYEDDRRNAALNYAYALIRGVIARHICAFGFIPCLGLHHHNMLNAFNLADDLIEPYRPLVDQFVLQGNFSKEGDFSLQDRRYLVEVFQHSCLLNQQKYTLLHACEKTVESLVTAINAGDPMLLFVPEVIYEEAN